MGKITARILLIALALAMLAPLSAPRAAAQAPQTPEAQAANWKFVKIGDTAPPDGTSYNPANDDHYQNVYGISWKAPDGERATVLNSGDMTDAGTVSNWQNFRTINAILNIDWNAAGMPQYIGAMGNHDNKNAANWKVYLPRQVNRSAYAGIAGSPNGYYGSVLHENALFLWLDSYHTSGEDAFLQATFARAKTDPLVNWIFVLLHVPPVACDATSSRASFDTTKAWTEKFFIPYKVDIIFAGHNHYYQRSCPLTSVNGSTRACDSANWGANRSAITNAKGPIVLISGGGGDNMGGGYTPRYTCNWVVPSKAAVAGEHHHFVEFAMTGYSLQATVWDTDTYADGTDVGTAFKPARQNFGIIDQFNITRTNRGAFISGTSPAHVLEGAGAFTLTINGAGFNSSSVVYWNGAAKPTTYVSATQLKVPVSSSEVRERGLAMLTVKNTTPEPYTSPPYGFMIAVEFFVPSVRR